MPTDSPPTPEAWHAELAEKDDAVRSAIAATSVETENAALHRRLDALMAELRIALAAVAVRDVILREQTAALHERDAEVAAAQAQLVATQSRLETIQATLSWRLSRRAARVLRVPRRLVRR
jgi:DNA repair exonuclease SbcCD ATPase subunit